LRRFSDFTFMEWKNVAVDKHHDTSELIRRLDSYCNWLWVTTSDIKSHYDGQEK
jgi:hypothetical protein